MTRWGKLNSKGNAAEEKSHAARTVARTVVVRLPASPSMDGEIP